MSFGVLFWLTLIRTRLQELAITSDEALSLEELPKRAVILGGGYVYTLGCIYVLYIVMSFQLSQTCICSCGGYIADILLLNLLLYGKGWVRT